MQTPNQGLDLLDLLRRRRVSFERWCLEEGILTQEDFEAKKVQIEKQGNFFFSDEFKNLACKLPAAPSEDSVCPSPQNPTESPEEPPKPQEMPTKKTRQKKLV